MLRIEIEIESSDIIGVKEILAMALEKLGRARIVKVEELETQLEWMKN